MRSITLTFGEKEYKLSANFKASLEIANTVADPMKMSREAAVEAMMLDRGFTYEPKFYFTVENVAQILWIGAKTSDKRVTLEDIQEAVFEEGFFSARDKAVEYLGLIIGPRPEIDFSRNEESESGE